MLRKIACLVFVTLLVLIPCTLQILAGEVIRAAEFSQLMQTVADGWDENNARKAADCFTENAVYTEPPDKQLYEGRETLFKFFGGDEGHQGQMKMRWHHLAFDEKSQIGFGEYTFRYEDYQTHGVAIVKVSNGRISNWREYQYKSDLEWERFVGKSKF